MRHIIGPKKPGLPRSKSVCVKALEKDQQLLLRTFLRYTDDSPSKTNRPLRQIALSDKSPSNTSANFYEPEERAICPS